MYSPGLLILSILPGILRSHGRGYASSACSEMERHRDGERRRRVSEHAADFPILVCYIILCDRSKVEKEREREVTMVPGTLLSSMLSRDGESSGLVLAEKV